MPKYILPFNCVPALGQYIKDKSTTDSKVENPRIKSISTESISSKRKPNCSKMLFFSLLLFVLLHNNYSFVAMETLLPYQKQHETNFFLMSTFTHEYFLVK